MVHADVFRSRAADFTHTGLNPIHNGITVVILLINRQDVVDIIVSVTVLSESVMIEFAIPRSLPSLVWYPQYAFSHPALFHIRDVLPVLTCQRFQHTVAHHIVILVERTDVFSNSVEVV